MSPEMLARRAVAAPGWCWMAGMLGRFSDGSSARIQDNGAGAFDGDHYHNTTELLPDLADAATLGCLLSLVRKAWGDPHLHVEWSAPDWWVYSGNGVYACAHPDAADKRAKGEHCCIGGPCHTPAAAPSEAEALVLALEAPPRRGQ